MTKNILLLLILTFLQFSCAQDPRKNSKIPPPFSDTPEKRLNSAIEFLTSAINSNPAVAENYYKRANLLLEKKDFNNALEDIEEAISIQSNESKYLYLKALVLKFLDKKTEAIKFAKQAESFGYNTPELNILLGELSIDAKKLQDAEKYLNESLIETPFSGETFYHLGVLKGAQKDSLTGIVLLKKSLELKPRNLATYLRLMEYQSSIKDYQEAKSTFQKGNSFFKDNTQLLVANANVYEQQGHLDTASTIHSRIVTANPNNLYSLNKLVSIYSKWKGYFKALEYAEKIRTIQPQNYEVINSTAYLYEMTGNRLKAEELYNLSVELKPQGNIAYERLAKIKYSINSELEIIPQISPKNKIQEPVITEAPVVRPTFDTTRFKIEPAKPKIKQQIKIDSTRFKGNE